jgi:hypothetical protein
MQLTKRRPTLERSSPKFGYLYAKTNLASVDRVIGVSVYGLFQAGPSVICADFTAVHES